MNKSYRTVWNEALGAWVAASEITKARGKRSRSGAVAVATAVLVALGNADYAGAQSIGGTATGGVATANRIDGVARNAYAGVAAAMAVQMPGTYVPGKTVMRLGSAVFKGESAVGISFRRTAENNGWSVTGGVGMSRAGVAATVGAEWVFN